MLPVLFLGTFAWLTHAQYPSTDTFDYIIIGGGPAGLVLANRLSEDPHVTVAVVEAGDAQFNNPNVTRVDTFGAGLNTSIDWQYISAPQKYTNDKELIYYSGKALGGTTTINGMTYLRAEKEQIDQWEAFGNEGWNWDSLFPYYRSEEHFQSPDASKAENGATYEGEFHGFEGEVTVGWSKYFMKQGTFEILKETNEALGVNWTKDPNGGHMRGFSTWPFTLNSSSNIRQDAARAYYYPVAEQRPNLHVFLNTTASKIVWADRKGEDGSVVAKSIEVVTPSNRTDTLHSSTEIILSAGSLRSPALLEHSGVGNPSILSPLGIETVIDLPSVGTNMQDQPTTFISYSSPTNWTGYPSYVTYLTASDLFGDDLESIADEVRKNTSTYAAQIVADAPAGSTTQELEEELIKLQTDLIFTPDSTVSIAELLWFPTPGAISCNYWSLLPFSRGSVHITSPDPTKQPKIDPTLFQLPIDIILQAAAAVKVREHFATPPLSDHVTAEITPGTSTVPLNTSYRDGKWADFIKSAYGPNYHPVSSCPMRKKELGGVVDGSGRLYGAQNVRVVDASIFPTQISGHLSAGVYAIALKIADSMKKNKS